MGVEPILTIAAAARATGIACLALERLGALDCVASLRVAGVRRVRLSAVLACLEECGAV
jgi:hypothetical protein